MTKEEIRISSHCPNLVEGMPYCDAMEIIVDKLDEYKKQIDEKQLIIDRLLAQKDEK